MGGLFGDDDDDCGGGGGGEVIISKRKVKKHKPPTPPSGYRKPGQVKEEEECVDMGGLGGDDYDDECCKEEEEDVDMGGMFGGGDSDYGDEGSSYPAAAQASAAATVIPAAASVPKSTKPSFDSLISLQSSSGFWKADASTLFARCILDGQIEDPSVRQAVQELNLAEDVDKESIYFTLLALFILEEVYQEKESEWQLIAVKAITWLVQVGVTQPQGVVRKFTLLPVAQ